MTTTRNSSSAIDRTMQRAAWSRLLERPSHVALASGRQGSVPYASRVAIWNVTIRKRAETILKNTARAQLVGAWVAAVLVMMACTVVAGAAITISSAELWVLACLMPPGVMLLLWHDDPPVTVAELLHFVNGQSKEGRP